MKPIYRAYVVALTSMIMLAGCGETFRPIATPIGSGGGDPQGRGNAVVLSTNGPGSDGSTTHVNISGDTNVGQVIVGQDPVRVDLVASGNLAYVSNFGSGNLSAYTTFLPLTAQPPVTVSLFDPSTTPNPGPVYVYSNSLAGLFVALKNANTVGVVGYSDNVLSKQIPVGTAPVALVGTNDGAKLYVANQGSANVSVITENDNLVKATVPVGGEPSALVITADNKYVFVVNRTGNSVSIIDTATDTVSKTVAVGATPVFAAYDPRQLRVYVANSAGNSVSIINADPNSVALFGTATTVAVGTNPTALAALADGSRVYVANSGANSISVITALSASVTQTISVGTLRPVAIGSSLDSAKVVVAVQDSVPASTTHADASGALVVRTSDNTVVATVPAPTTPCPANSGFLGCRMKPVHIAVTP